MLGGKIMISGAAGTGKTTLINALEKAGFNCLEEISRKWIDQQLKVDGDALPWKDVEKFAIGCLNELDDQLSAESNPAFCDRGPLDYSVHLSVRGKQLPKNFGINGQLEAYERFVFYCPLWKEIYRQEPQRPENFEHQIRVDRLTKKAYKDAGFHLIELPKKTVDERVAFILKNLSDEKIQCLKSIIE